MLLLKITGIIILTVIVIISFFLFFPALIDIKAEKTFFIASIKFYIGIIKIKFEISGNNTDIGWYIFGKRVREGDKEDKKKSKKPLKKKSVKTAKEKPSKKKAYTFIDKLYTVIESIIERDTVEKGLEIIKSTIGLPKYKKCEVNFKFGFENPADTGIVYGLLCAVFSQLPIKPKAEPDFENEVFEFSADIKGYFNVCKLIVFMIKLLSDKETSEIMQKWFG